MLYREFQAFFLGHVETPPGLAESIATSRRRRFHAMAPLAAIHSLLTAIVLTLALWSEPVMPLVFVWCYASAVLVFIRVREARRPVLPGQEKAEDTKIIAYTLFSGAFWGLIVAALVASSGQEQHLFLGILTAAILSVGAFLHSSFPIASLGYSLTIALGACLGLVVGHHQWSINAALLLAAGITALQRFSAETHASDVRRIIDASALKDAKDTVELLLTDFEAHSSDWLWRIDQQYRIGPVSQRFADAAGLPPETLQGANLLALFDSASANTLNGLLSGREPFRDVVLGVSIGAHQGWWSMSGQPTEDGGWRGVSSDITSSRNAEAAIAYATEFDSLTDLPNRAMLIRQLQIAEEAAEANGETFALFVIDLDNFKTINDTQGHPSGDAFLKVVARRLRSTLEPGAFLARLGGDEFAILQRNMDADAAGEMAEILVDALLAPVTLNGRDILSGGSVGVAIGPDNGGDPAILMKHAELALYSAKAQGRGCARLFEAGMDESARVRADLEADLRIAVAGGAMDVYFQPLVNVRTHVTAGYETLLRWNRPGHGMVSPGVFISCAEETGIIVPLGEWVIRKAIEEAATWREDVPVAVNLSPAQMKNPSLLTTVVGALAASQLPPSRLEIEIVESVLMDETEATLRTLHSLRELGVRIALDDFGTGYSSLSYLRSFPFDKIKIDQCFVRDIASSMENQAIVRATISLARDLGMKITAEGVETEQQAAILASLGCHEVQGYLYSRPVPASQLEKRDGAQRLGNSPVAMRRRA